MILKNNRRLIKLITGITIITMIALTIMPAFAATKDSMQSAGDMQSANISMSEEELLIKLRDQYFGYNYIIGNDNIEILVNEDNTYQITENFSAYFLTPGKEIVKKIPLNNKIKNSSGQSASRTDQISKVSIKSEGNISGKKKGSIYDISIKTDKSVTGIHQYEISYKYDCGNDPFEDMDSFFYDFTGGFDVPVLRTSYTVVMPKAFPSQNIKFNQACVYDNVGTRISGSYEQVLMPENSLVLQIDLPADYYIKREVNPYVKYFYYIPPIFLLIMGIVWLFAGRNKKLKYKKTSVPPEGLNNIDVGYVNSGKTDDSSVISIFFSLLRKGYISIESSGVYIINREKDYTEDNRIEKTFYDGLFLTDNYASQRKTVADIAKLRLKKDTDSSGDYFDAVTVNDLKGKFNTTIKVIKQMEDKENNSDFYVMSNKITVAGIIVSGIFYLALILIPYISVHMLRGLSFGKIILLILPFVFLLAGIMIIKKFKVPDFNRNLPIGAACVVLSIITLIITLIGGFYQPIKETSLLLFIVDYIAVCFILFISMSFKKRSKFGNKLYYKVKGFKEYLQTVDPEILANKSTEDPEYFYDYLGYAYALGIGNVWVKKFKNIAIQKPQWFKSDFSFGLLGKALNEIFKNMK